MKRTNCKFVFDAGRFEEASKFLEVEQGIMLGRYKLAFRLAAVNIPAPSCICSNNAWNNVDYSKGTGIVLILNHVCEGWR